jgi:hypothetical protein
MALAAVYVLSKCKSEHVHDIVSENGRKSLKPVIF